MKGNPLQIDNFTITVPYQQKEYKLEVRQSFILGNEEGFQLSGKNRFMFFHCNRPGLYYSNNIEGTFIWTTTNEVLNWHFWNIALTILERKLRTISAEQKRRSTMKPV